MWSDNPYDRNSPQSASTGILANQYLATGFLRVYGFSVYSSNAASQFIQMFDASTLPANAAVPIMTFPVSAQSNVGVYFGPMGRIFRRGFALCSSSTDTTKTLNATSDCFFDVEFDNVPTAPPPGS